MKQFFTKLFTLFLFLLACYCFYVATVVVFANSFVNIALFVVAIFVLIQACGNLDKNLGYGKWNTDKKNEEK